MIQVHENSFCCITLHEAERKNSLEFMAVSGGTFFELPYALNPKPCRFGAEPRGLGPGISGSASA